MIEIPNSRELLTQWCKYINNGKFEKLLQLYDDNSILIPTFSERMITTNEERKAYFGKLFSRKQLMVKLHKKEPIVQNLGYETEVISGLYFWKYQIDEEDYIFEARYSFIVDIRREKPILHHHSSQIPRGV